MSTPGPTPPSEREELASLVARCILGLERDGQQAVVDLLDQHPALAEAARAQLAELQRAGLLVPAAPEPEAIGRYRIVRRLGAGGMGTVYLAEQQEPVQRRVALKVIRPGMDSREVLARFAVERQALAVLDHPNIARVLDAGTTDDGRPFLCMEYVAGVPITRFCDERGLTVVERIELMARVCDAVQAAHQKGILHRDLKPSNILVGDRDGRPWPTVIDFGVAKSLGPRLLDVTLLTGQGAMLGTPEYMSPEQAASELDLDTRTDVFSLGAVLYELLTGAMPFESRRLRGAAPGELLRILKEEDPPSPSTRITQMGAEAGDAARRRRTEPAALRRGLRGELDWIAMKALEKDRGRRYGMAADLAADLRRHLQDEPVTAGPPSAWYRWRKFVRRHRLQAAAAAAVFVALLAGLAASFAFYREAAAKVVEADASLEVALTAVERMIRAGEDRLQLVPRMEEVRRELLEEAVILHRRLAGAGEADRVGLRTVRSLRSLGSVQAQLGRSEEAEASLSEALDLLARLPADTRAGRGVQVLAADLDFALAMLRLGQGRPAPAVDPLLARARARVVELLRTGAADAGLRQVALDVLSQQARDVTTSSADARALYQQIMELVRPVLARAADDLDETARATLAAARHASFLIDMGEPEPARRLAAEMRGTIDTVLAGTTDVIERARFLPPLRELGTVRYRTGQLAELAADLEPTIAIERELVRDFPAVDRHRLGLATALSNRASALQKLGRMAEAERCMAESLALVQALRRDRPGVPDYRTHVIQFAGNLAQVLVQWHGMGGQVDWAAAEDAVAVGEQELGTATGLEPDRELREAAAEFHRAAGLLHAARGRLPAAIAAQRQSVALLRQLADEQPDAVMLRRRQVDVQKDLARSLLADGAAAEAERLTGACMELLDAMRGRLDDPVREAESRRALIELQVQASIAAGDLTRVGERLDAYLAESPDPAHDWLGREQCARLALAAAEAAGVDQVRAALLDRARAEVAAGLAKAASFATTNPVMLAIQRANSLRVLVAVERLAAAPAAAAAAQAGVVDGYLQAFQARDNERNRTRAAAACDEWVQLLLQAGDHAGARAAAERMAAAFAGHGDELVRAAGHLADAGRAAAGASAEAAATACGEGALRVLGTALAAGFGDGDRLRQDPRLGALRELPGFAGLLQGLGRR